MHPRPTGERVLAYSPRAPGTAHLRHRQVMKVKDSKLT